MQKADFALAPSLFGYLWIAIVTAIVVIPPVLFFGYLSWSLRTAKVTIDKLQVVIGVPFYSLAISRDAIVNDTVDTVTCDSGSRFAPVSRLNGIGIPGLRLGWFKLHNGKKALVCLTRFDRATYFESRDGFAVLFSASDSESLASNLKAPGGG